jgi:hypothetical protein
MKIPRSSSQSVLILNIESHGEKGEEEMVQRGEESRGEKREVRKAKR